MVWGRTRVRGAGNLPGNLRGEAAGDGLVSEAQVTCQVTYKLQGLKLFLSADSATGYHVYHAYCRGSSYFSLRTPLLATAESAIALHSFGRTR